MDQLTRFARTHPAAAFTLAAIATALLVATITTLGA